MNEEIPAQKEKDDSNETHHHFQNFSGQVSNSYPLPFYEESDSEFEDHVDEYWTPLDIEKSKLPDAIKRRLMKQSVLSLSNSSLDKSSFEPPAWKAQPDEQGNFETCTRHALSKAICDGCWDKIFHCEQINLNQAEVTEALIALNPEMLYKGMWPKEFSKKKFEFTDQTTNRKWVLQLLVSKTEKDGLIDEATSQKPLYKHVMVYRTIPEMMQKSPSHCVFVKKLMNPEGEEYTLAHCYNSNLYEPDLYRPLDQPGNMFFKVWCLMMERKQKDTQPKPLKDHAQRLFDKTQHIHSRADEDPLDLYNKLRRVI